MGDRELGGELVNGGGGGDAGAGSGRGGLARREVVVACGCDAGGCFYRARGRGGGVAGCGARLPAHGGRDLV